MCGVHAILGVDAFFIANHPQVFGMPRVEGYTDYFGLDTLLFDRQDARIVYGHNGGEGIIRLTHTIPTISCSSPS